MRCDDPVILRNGIVHKRLKENRTESRIHYKQQRQTIDCDTHFLALICVSLFTFLRSSSFPIAAVATIYVFLVPHPAFSSSSSFSNNYLLFGNLFQGIE